MYLTFDSHGSVGNLRFTREVSKIKQEPGECILSTKYHPGISSKSG